MIALLLLVTSGSAWAHGFGQRFTLPLPFWLYGSGACAALLLSFVVLLWKRPAGGTSTGEHRWADSKDSMGASDRVGTGNEPDAIGSAGTFNPAGTFSHATYAWMALNAALMLLAIVSGAFGSQHAASNFSMTWFWIYFLLGFFYIAAFAGKNYQLLNPWWCAAQLWCAVRKSPAGHSITLNSLSAWPAFAGYMLLIELELFGHASPQRLSIFLAAYTALWLIVSIISGPHVWFRQFDTFSALFEHVSRLRGRDEDIGQIDGNSKSNSGFRLHGPSRLLSPISTAAQMLICAMLASTAFDALKESVPWATELWKLLLTLFPQNSTNPLAILSALSETYRNAEMLAWLLMPFAYFALMALMVAASRHAAPVAHAFSCDMSLAALALLPLVLGYHVAHYFPLLLSEGPNLIHLLSDPLGEGWNLFGTASLLRAPIMLETDTVWHLQVALIVIGHLGGVLVSHWQACQIHATQRAVLLSQLPMLVWMMGLTTWGLWILSQPMKV